MLLQAVVVFSYAWGRAQAPSAARLFIAIDTFFSFFAAWALASALKRWRPFVSVLVAAAVLAIHLPVATQHRFLNRLTQTREAATAWRFFEIPLYYGFLAVLLTFVLALVAARATGETDITPGGPLGKIMQLTY